MLKFPDDTRIRVNGLAEILVELYSEGREVNRETAEEIIIRLEALNNFIPQSELIRREYAYLLQKEYQEFVESHTDNKG